MDSIHMFMRIHFIWESEIISCGIHKEKAKGCFVVSVKTNSQLCALIAFIRRKMVERILSEWESNTK